MNERLKESLSALLDGEVNELELQRVLAHDDKQAVSTCWQHYHEIKSLMQSDKLLRVNVDIRGSVMDVINKDEPPHKA